MTDGSPAAVLDGPAALAMVRQGCEAAGRPPGGELLRLGEDAVVRLPDGVLARVGLAGGVATARHEVAVSRWLASSGVPAVRAAPGRALVEVDGRAVTFWSPLPAHRPGASVAVARALRRLHSLPLPTAPALPPLDPFRRVEPRLRRSPLLTSGQRDRVLQRLTGLRAEYARLPPGLPAAVVHGDAWAGNVVETVDGDVVLLDLVRVGIGPPEWDLVATALNRSTFGIMDEAEYEAFAAEYGLDVLAWPGFTTLRDIREIRVVAYALHAAEVDAGVAPQARARIADLLAGVRPWPGWVPL
jgi:aminoglycoside phosphotransferase (APT) family kinase protein